MSISLNDKSYRDYLRKISSPDSQITTKTKSVSMSEESKFFEDLLVNGGKEENIKNEKNQKYKEEVEVEKFDPNLKVKIINEVVKILGDALKNQNQIIDWSFVESRSQVHNIKDTINAKHRGKRTSFKFKFNNTSLKDCSVLVKKDNSYCEIIFSTVNKDQSIIIQNAIKRNQQAWKNLSPEINTGLKISLKELYEK